MKTNELDVQTIQYLGKPSRTDRYPISGWPDRNRWLEGGSVLPLPTEYIDAEFSVAAKALNRILRDARDRLIAATLLLGDPEVPTPEYEHYEHQAKLLRDTFYDWQRFIGASMVQAGTRRMWRR